MSKNVKTIFELIEKHGRGLMYVQGTTQEKEYKGCKYFLYDGEKIYLETKTQKEMIEKLKAVCC